MDNYLKTAEKIYKEAAESPQVGLCCTSSPIWKLPELSIPSKMLAMNYGCGSTVHPRDLSPDSKVLYVGVGGGMELLQFAYFSRRMGAVIGVDPVVEMLDACGRNLKEAELENEWFDKDFIELKNGNALQLPLENESIDVAAQNCLFNIFEEKELKTAISEMYRVLKPFGRLILSDPVSDDHIDPALQNDPKLRALCLSGAMPLKDYIGMLTDAGFGTIEIRAKRPYRILDPKHYKTAKNVYIESVEVCAIKDPMPKDGPCIFTGKSAIYFGQDEAFDDGQGHVLLQNQPLAVCDKTAKALERAGNGQIFISPSTYFYDGGGCC